MLLPFLLFIGEITCVDQATRTANKIKEKFSCDNFQVKFRVTKRQLYKSPKVPVRNTFKLGVSDNCIKELTLSENEYTSKSGAKWREMNLDVELPFFDADHLNECGAQFSQDEFGIVYEIQIKGKRAKSFPEKYVAQTIIFQCFYPLAKTPYDDLPTDLKSFVDETYVIGSQSMQFRKMGNLTSEFMLYDVLDETNVFYPNTIDTKPIKVGAPVMTGVKPKDELSNIFVHAPRWDYFLRDCIFWGLHEDGETFNEIQLIKRNCKTTKYHVQQLTKYGTKENGHMMMFEAIAFANAKDHYLTCDVDICMKNIDGTHIWPGCYQPCTGPQFVSQSAEESEFQLTTVITPVEGVVAPDVTVEPNLGTDTDTGELIPTVEAAAPMGQTYATTQTVSEPFDDLLDAEAFCIEQYSNGNFMNSNPDLFTLCQYIKSRYPDSF